MSSKDLDGNHRAKTEKRKRKGKNKRRKRKIPNQNTQLK